MERPNYKSLIEKYGIIEGQERYDIGVEEHIDQLEAENKELKKKLERVEELPHEDVTLFLRGKQLNPNYKLNGENLIDIIREFKALKK
jgi:hypothetical protein